MYFFGARDVSTCLVRVKRGQKADCVDILTERLQQVLLDSGDAAKEWLAKHAWKGRRRAEFPPCGELDLAIVCFVYWTPVWLGIQCS